MSSGVGCRRSLDLALLWLRPRLAAVALTAPLAWEPPFAVGVALKKAKKKKIKKNKVHKESQKRTLFNDKRINKRILHLSIYMILT